MRIFDLSHFWNWPNTAICARFLFITISLTTTQTMTQIKSGMFGFLTFCNRTITPKIRLFSAICGKNRVYVISLVFVKKVLTKRDSVCYNNQAVREQGHEKPGDRQRRTLNTIQRKRVQDLADLRREPKGRSEEARFNSQNSMSKTP